MDCLVINQNKIKITLTSSELKKYGLCFSDIAPLDTVADRYWQIIDAALKIKPGFTVGERLLIQSYPVESGAELFVTKLGKSCDAVEKSPPKAQNSMILASRSAMFPFDSFDELVNAVLHVSAASCHNSSLHYSDDGVYYLFCEERTFVGVCSYTYRLAEFAKPIPPIMHSYVIEHSEIIISKNALSELCGIKKEKSD